MTDEDFNRRLRDIADLAKRQREGPYDARSDSVQALACVETLAMLLIEGFNAKRGLARGCCRYCAGAGNVENNSPGAPSLLCPVCHGDGQLRDDEAAA